MRNGDFLGSACERDLALIELDCKVGDQSLERLLQQALVFGLSRLEPGAIVVEREVHEKLHRFTTETLEVGVAHGCNLSAVLVLASLLRGFHRLFFVHVVPVAVPAGR